MSRSKTWSPAALLLAALAGDVAADVKPPTGWQSNPEFAAALSPRTDLFGGVPASSTTEVYRAPVRGAVLYVTRAEAKLPAAQRDAAASYELEELRRAFDRAGADAKVQTQAQRVDAAAKVMEGTVAWRDEAAGVVNSRRTAIAADAERVVAMTGECVLAVDVAPEIAKACEAALASIVPDIPVDQRVALSIVGSPSTAVAPAAPPSPPAPSGAVTSSGPGMSDASKLPPIPPMVVSQPPAKQQPDADRRPVYLGLGLLVLAIIFYMNRKRREKFERDEPPARAADDDDDDDLHAAADSESPKKGDDDTN